MLRGIFGAPPADVYVDNFFFLAIFHAMNNVEKKSLSGIVSLRDMLEYSMTNDFVFHGSPVKLTPGTDFLIPHCALRERVNRVYLANFPQALRFALVRGWGRDQQYGQDFYVFATEKYRLVIYSAREVGDNWYDMPVNKSAYLYAVARRDLGGDVDSTGCARKKLPIVARATINQAELANAGFSFAGETDLSTVRWWGVRNSDDVILRDVLPLLPCVSKRNQR